MYHGTESLESWTKNMGLVPSNLKDMSGLDKFNKAIKQWKPENCPCRLWNVFVQNVDVLEKITWKM